MSFNAFQFSSVQTVILGETSIKGLLVYFKSFGKSYISFTCTKPKTSTVYIISLCFFPALLGLQLSFQSLPPLPLSAVTVDVVTVI